MILISRTIHTIDAKKLELWLLPRLHEYSITLHQLEVCLGISPFIYITWNKDAAEGKPGHLPSVSCFAEYELFLLALIRLIALLHVCVFGFILCTV